MGEQYLDRNCFLLLHWLCTLVTVDAGAATSGSGDVVVTYWVGAAVGQL